MSRTELSCNKLTKLKEIWSQFRRIDLTMVNLRCFSVLCEFKKLESVLLDQLLPNKDFLPVCGDFAGRLIRYCVILLIATRQWCDLSLSIPLIMESVCW